jgi:hypothetical protein
MSKLDILGQSLQTLHGSLISEVIDVLLAKRGTATTSEAKDNVSVQLGAGSSPKDTVDGIRTILQFVRSSLTAADLPGLHLFSTHLQHEAFSGVLSRLVLPSMPSTTSGLPVWLALVRACASCEEEFTDSSESGKGVLAQFAQRDAANRWLGKFRHVRLQRARGLFGSWATVGVKAVEVDVREEVQEVQDVEMLEVGVEALETPSAPIEAEEEGDSGWGFDDEDEPPAPAAEPEPAPADDDEDGWGFDDDTPAPTPAPKPKAPVREAKRLGKRVPRARSSSQSRSPSPPPAIPEPVPQPEPEPAPAPKPTLRARPTPPPAPLKLVRVVSAACDTVLAIPAEVLREIEAIRSLDEPTFADAPAGMADVLSEELDFICATIPVAVVHAEAQRGPSVGATLRMGNEYAYLADRLAEGNTSAWTAEASVERFKNTGELVRSTAVEEQLVELSSALDGARHFVEMSHDAFFREAQAAVSATMARLETVAAEAKVS